MSKEQRAFGAPKGTVRATAFLMVLGTICYDALWGQNAIPVSVFTTLVGTMAGFYFGQKVGVNSKEIK